jgi:hypothetical protein
MTKFQAKRITRTYALDVTGKPEEIFSLLCPVREYEWIDGWTCDLIYSASGLIEEDCIFTTTEFPPIGYTVWVTTDNDVEHQRKEFVRVTPGLMVVHTRVKVEKNGAGRSKLHYDYTVTALSEKGNTHLEKLAEDDYKLMDFEAHWLGRLLDHFTRTGTKLERKDWRI